MTRVGLVRTRDKRYGNVRLLAAHGGRLPLRHSVRAEDGGETRPSMSPARPLDRAPPSLPGFASPPSSAGHRRGVRCGIHECCVVVRWQPPAGAGPFAARWLGVSLIGTERGNVDAQKPSPANVGRRTRVAASALPAADRCIWQRTPRSPNAEVSERRPTKKRRLPPPRFYAVDRESVSVPSAAAADRAKRDQAEEHHGIGAGLRHGLHGHGG